MVAASVRALWVLLRSAAPQHTTARRRRCHKMRSDCSLIDRPGASSTNALNGVQQAYIN